MQGLVSKPIHTFSKPADPGGDEILIRDVHYMGSYNYVNSPNPTILVPGSPPVWRERRLPYRVPRDSGMRFVDQNGYRMPSCPLLPMFRAIDLLVEEDSDSIDLPEWSDVDFVTDRNALRKLMRWLNDDGSAKQFRIDTQLAGSGTILLNRWERRTREEPDPKIWTYGLNFEFESTTVVEGCERSTGHFRTIRYNFDGMLLVVRSSVDACLTAPAAEPAPTSSANVDGLLSMLSGMSVKTADSPGSTRRSDDTSTRSAPVIGLQVRRAGAIVPQESIIEMATRSKKRIAEYDWVDVFPQLWLSQTPHHFLAAHDRGTFEAITKRTLDGAELKRIQAESQAGFRRLRRALQDIKELVMKHGKQGRLSLVFRDGELQALQRVSQESCLPESVMERFE